MDNRDATVLARRRFITIVGGSALLAPFVGLAGCGGKEEAPTAGGGSAPAAGQNQPTAPQAATDMAPERAAPPEPAAQAGSQQAGAGGAMPKLSEDDPQAKSLAYVHNSADVIASEQPRHKPEQACSNCQLYQGAASDEWAGCPLFAGKLVKGTGWCTAYAPRSG